MRRPLAAGVVLLAGTCAAAVALESTRPPGTSSSVAPTPVARSSQARPMTLREYTEAANAFAASLSSSDGASSESEAVNAFAASLGRSAGAPPVSASTQSLLSLPHVPPVLLLFEP